MKTTSFKISKQLAKVGFKSETNWVWTWSGDDHQLLCFNSVSDKAEDLCYALDKDFLSYGLETILQALPKSIKYRGDTYYFWMTYSGSSDCYIIGYVCGQVRKTELEKYSEENESLADTAARLWLNLKEKGLV